MTTVLAKISRPKSAYILFYKSERDQVKKDIPDILNKDILPEIGKRWKKLPESDPERYSNLQLESEKDKQRYKSEIESSGVKSSIKNNASKNNKHVEVQTDNTAKLPVETFPEKKKRAPRQKKNNNSVVPTPGLVEVVVETSSLLEEPAVVVETPSLLKEPEPESAVVVEDKPVATKRLRKGKTSKK